MVNIYPKAKFKQRHLSESTGVDLVLAASTFQDKATEVPSD